MLQKPSTKGGFSPPIPTARYLYTESAQLCRFDGHLADARAHPRLRQLTYRTTRLGNLVSSFQIEGIPIDRARAARVLGGESPATPHEGDIARFGALYDELHAATRLPRLTPELIRAWHERLFTPETLDHGMPGAWKTDTNGIWDNAKGDWVFIATPKEDTIAELEALIAWHDNEAYRLPPPMAAAIFFAEFESIHPFPDGNGRIGRLLNLWALKKNGLENAFLAPIDERFKRTQSSYYAALASTNSGQTYAGYCGYYLAELHAAYQHAHQLGGLDEIFHQLARPASRNALEWILTSRSEEWFKRADYPNEERVSDATLTNVLGELTDLGLLEARGERKGRQYKLDWGAILDHIDRVIEAEGA